VEHAEQRRDGEPIERQAERAELDHEASDETQRRAIATS
jgi:hypothetical protein